MGLALIPTWEWIWMIFGSFSAIVHCIVLFTIHRARHLHKDPFFKGPFFVIVLIQILEFLTVNLINRLRKYQIIYYTLEEDNNLVEWEWYWYNFIKNILYLGHFYIAANRLSAFILTGVGTYNKVWNTRSILLLTLVSYLISGILRVIVYSPSVQCTTLVYESTHTFAFSFSDNVLMYDSIVELIFSSTSAILCAIFYIITAILAHKFKNTISASSRSHDMLLLKVGVATFFVFLPTPIRTAVELWGIYTGHDAIKEIVFRFTYVPAEAMCICQPWILLMSCTSLRQRLVNLCRYEKENRVTKSDPQSSIAVIYANP